MNILSLVLPFIFRDSQTSDPIYTNDSRDSPVESSPNIEEKVSTSQKELEYLAQFESQNGYHPRFLPDFATDNLNYLSSHPALRPR